MSRPRIFITQPVAHSAIARLQGVAAVDFNPDSARIPSKDEMLAAVRQHDILFCLLQDCVDAEVIAANPGLRMIASMKITPSDIDVAAATARRIPVTVIPPVVTEATADIHFALLLAVARRALGFSMRVLYWTPRRKSETVEREAGISYVPFDQLLAESDFVSMHAPLTPETRHLMGAREFALMKPTAFFVNTARGAVVDEAALARSLAERRLAGAGLDVFEHEPHVEPALLAMENVVLTPHLGSAVRELRESMAHIVVDNILALLEGRQPPNCWNPEIYSAPG